MVVAVLTKIPVEFRVQPNTHKIMLRACKSSSFIKSHSPREVERWVEVDLAKEAALAVVDLVKVAVLAEEGSLAEEVSDKEVASEVVDLARAAVLEEASLAGVASVRAVVLAGEVLVAEDLAAVVAWE